MINALRRRRNERRSRRHDAMVSGATALFVGRGMWRMYRGRSPWSAGRRGRRRLIRLG